MCMLTMEETVVPESNLELESDAAALFDCPGGIKPEQYILRPDAKVKLD